MSRPEQLISCEEMKRAHDSIVEMLRRRLNGSGDQPRDAEDCFAALGVIVDVLEITPRLATPFAPVRFIKPEQVVLINVVLALGKYEQIIPFNRLHGSEGRSQASAERHRQPTPEPQVAY